VRHSPSISKASRHKIHYIAREAVDRRVAPIATSLFQEDVAFGRQFSAEIWDRYFELRAMPNPVKAALTPLTPSAASARKTTVTTTVEIEDDDDEPDDDGDGDGDTDEDEEEASDEEEDDDDEEEDDDDEDDKPKKRKHDDSTDDLTADDPD
jgi:hypothetical protein